MNEEMKEERMNEGREGGMEKRRTEGRNERN